MKKSVKRWPMTILLGLLVLAGCTKDKVEPDVPMGKLLTYTNIPKPEFDRIDIIVDGKVAGSLTQPFTVKPICGAETSATTASIPLTAGIHKIYAIQYKNGKNVGEWNEEDENIVEGKCLPINWTD